jgi:hypothetical protein
MTRNLRFVCLSAMLSTATALAQVVSHPIEGRAPAASADVAYVYVASTPANSNVSEVLAYTADANGILTPVDGSPFSANVNSLAVNGKFLFGSDNDGTDMDAYTLEPNGALSLSAQTSVVEGDNCDSPGPIFLDHTGQSLYNVDIYGNVCANSTYEAFSIASGTGAVTFLDYAGASPEHNQVLRFIGNNQFGYSSSCYDFNAAIFGVERASNGSLTMLNDDFPYPTPPSGEGWCPVSAAADATNHLAFAMALEPSYGELGTYQLASYTAGSTGNLTTTNTYTDMPAVQVGSVTDLNMAPSGELLAVSGTTGLEVFHFNGANPVTTYTGLLTTDEVDQVFWDNDNHLYAIGEGAGKVWVFTVTPTAYDQAADSPYAVSQPGALIVQPLPLP